MPGRETERLDFPRGLMCSNTRLVSKAEQSSAVTVQEISYFQDGFQAADQVQKWLMVRSDIYIDVAPSILYVLCQS
jgi:hypothetical protein